MTNCAYLVFSLPEDFSEDQSDYSADTQNQIFGRRKPAKKIDHDFFRMEFFSNFTNFNKLIFFVFYSQDLISELPITRNFR